MPSGEFRTVLLLGALAMKIPRLNNLAKGMRSNRWEREMWNTWRPIFHWENLGPVIAADPLGLFVLMPRAIQPVTFQEMADATGDYYPDITAETKPDDWGRIDGRVVALDYGLPDRDLVEERRAYYKEKAVQLQ